MGKKLIGQILGDRGFRRGRDPRTSQRTYGGLDLLSNVANVPNDPPPGVDDDDDLGGH